MLAAAEAKGEPPFLFLLDNIEDPHNLWRDYPYRKFSRGARSDHSKASCSRTDRNGCKNVCGSDQELYTGREGNKSDSGRIKELKERGIWFVCADMGGTGMYELDLKGPIGLVIGNEGDGVSKLVRENCDFIASIPMRGEIDSLNASVAAGVLAYEIVRQRMS